MPKLSVILPAYNAERYLAPAVQSILDQTYRDFELIVVDDGSTDRTLEMLRQFQQRDPRLKIISRPNTGHVIAAIDGVNASSGELIARMDADDIALPHRLEKQMAFMEAHPQVVLLGGAYELIDEQGRLITTVHQPLDDESLQSICLTGRCPICHPLAMFRRDAYERVGGYRPEFSPAEDIDLWLRMGEVGPIACLRDVLLQYRQHSQSISALKQQMQIENLRRACKQAWQRRGVSCQFAGDDGWRPGTGRISRHRYALRYGWWAFNSAQRRTAMVYGLKAIATSPISIAGWRLLACALLKPLPVATPISHFETRDKGSECPL